MGSALNKDQGLESVQLELPLEVLRRLLHDGALVASEYRCLNARSSRAGWLALKQCLMDSAVPGASAGPPTIRGGKLR